MNGTFILIGYRSANAAPENLYTGTSGEELVRTADEARESGKYASGRLIRLVNPVGTPLAPAPMGKPAAVVTAATPAEVINSTSRKFKK